MKSPKWKDLFDYLDGKVKFGDGITIPLSASCKNDHRDVKNFAKHFDLNENDLIRLVRSYGGYCDCEVLLNMTDSIDEELEIPTTDKEVRKQMGPSDDEPRPGDKWLVWEEGVGWHNFEDLDVAQKAFEEMKGDNRKVFEPQIDITDRIKRGSKLDY